MLALDEVLSDFAAYAEYGADTTLTVGSRSTDGETPLHWMSALGDCAAIGLLVSAGADLDARDKQGNAPIHAACASKQVMAAKALIDAGANFRLENASGLTALDISKESGYQPCIELLVRLS